MVKLASFPDVVPGNGQPSGPVVDFLVRKN
jgi:hypothetical protein